MCAASIGTDKQAVRPSSAEPPIDDGDRAGGDRPSRRSNRRFLLHVHEVIAENVSRSEFDVNDVAGELGISKRTLERRMKQVTGMSPARYVRELRLMRASCLVEVGDVTTVDRLASSVGFRDADYFSRLYRRTFGRSPAELMQ